MELLKSSAKSKASKRRESEGAREGEMKQEDGQCRKRKRGKRRYQKPSNLSPPRNDSTAAVVPPSRKSTAASTCSFLEKMKARLSGGHFRMINEKLYTCRGEEAFNYFKEDPELFRVYHSGYQEQMSHWPQLPINIITRWIKDHDSSLVVADFGCGDARLSRSVKNKVISLDLISSDPSVISCDMANTPLDSFSVDVAVFCLSLMGTNYQSYLQEAYRVLKPGGWLLIAEVKSRFDPNTGGADPNEFLKAVCELGFTSKLKDSSNKMFILLYFKKKERLSAKEKEIDWPTLKPCLYKRR